MSHLGSNLAWECIKRSLAVGVVLSCCLLRWTGQSMQTTTPLVLNQPIECEIAAGATHSYTLTLDSGQYAHLVVDQRGVDVVVSIYAPDGTTTARVDSPNGSSGVEPV